MIILMLVLLGLVLGSFVNALVWRLYTHKDWIGGRSECTQCHHVLAAADLIPVVSWLLLRGKCRYCHKKIDDNPLVELTLPVLFVLSYYLWPLSFSRDGMVIFLLWLPLLTVLLGLAVYDMRWMLLPNKLVLTAIVLGFIYAIAIAVYKADWVSVISALGGAIVISGIFYIIFQYSKGKWIGGGDVKLGVVLGLVAGGVLPSLVLLLVASLIGLLIALPKAVQGKLHRKYQLPFGPCLIAGLIIIVLFGTSIISWYTNLLTG